MNLGNGFGIAKGGGTNLDTGHEKTETGEETKNPTFSQNCVSDFQPRM